MCYVFFQTCFRHHVNQTKYVFSLKIRIILPHHCSPDSLLKPVVRLRGDKYFFLESKYYFFLCVEDCPKCIHQAEKLIEKRTTGRITGKVNKQKFIRRERTEILFQWSMFTFNYHSDAAFGFFAMYLILLWLCLSISLRFQFAHMFRSLHMCTRFFHFFFWNAQSLKFRIKCSRHCMRVSVTTFYDWSQPA